MPVSAKLSPIHAHRKVGQLRQRLATLANGLGPGGKFPTVRELSLQLGISLSTLHGVLNEMERDKLIVRKHGQGIFVANTSKASTLALVSGNDPFEAGQSPFYQLICDALRQGVNRHNHVSRFYLDPQFDDHGLPTRGELIEDIEAGRLLGAVFLATRHPDDLLWLNSRNFPYVALTDCPYASHRYYMNYPDLVELGVRTLVSRGCRRLGLISWDGPGGLHGKCVERFRQLMAEYSLECRDNWLWNKQPGEETGRFPQRKTGVDAVRHILDGESGLDGIVCTDDMLASGALHALRELGVQPGKDLLMITHANQGSPVLDLFQDRIIRMEVNVTELAGALLVALEELISGTGLAPFNRHIKAEIVE